jgi:hypothetical protein
MSEWVSEWVIQFSYLFVCIISTTTDSDYFRFVRRNLEVWHHHHVCSVIMWNMVYAEFMGMFMIYLCAKCHIPRSSGSLVVATDKEPSIDFIRSSYCLYRIYPTRHSVFFSGIYVYPHYFRTLRGSSIDRISEVRIATMLIFCTLGN